MIKTKKSAVMKSIAISISILTAVIISAGTSYSQQTIQAELGDTLVITIDTARGALQWEVSHDTIVWVAVTGQQSKTLTAIADSLPVYYRLEIIEGECEAWYSEILEVTEYKPFMCGTDSVGHGYVFGITPDNSVVFANRMYSTVQAAWSGTGGDKCWLKMNLGATREATSATDTGLDAAGWYFQFNRNQGYVNDGTTRIPGTPWINPINENSNWDLFNDPCRILLGSDWRIPTQAEWNAFLTASTATGGVGSGVLTDAFNSTLKLHAGGNLSGGDGSLQNVGSNASFWSSEQNSNNTAGSFRFSGTGSFPVNATKNFGYPLRCILDQ